jgi:hypothetical protein
MSKRYKILGQFVPHRVALIESPSWCVLSLSARRVLDRIEIEMCHQGGAHENGRLVVTHADFIKHGVHHDAVAPAIREVEALGLAEITERGRGGNAAWRRPNEFRLTYIQTKSANADAYHDPTDEWRRIKTIEEAERKASDARNAPSATAPWRAADWRRRKKQKATPVKGTIPAPQNGGGNNQVSPPEDGGKGHPRKTGVLSISPVTLGEAGPAAARTRPPPRRVHRP